MSFKVTTQLLLGFAFAFVVSASQAAGAQKDKGGTGKGKPRLPVEVAFQTTEDCRDVADDISLPYAHGSDGQFTIVLVRDNQENDRISFDWGKFNENNRTLCVTVCDGSDNCADAVGIEELDPNGQCLEDIRLFGGTKFGLVNGEFVEEGAVKLLEVTPGFPVYVGASLQFELVKKEDSNIAFRPRADLGCPDSKPFLVECLDDSTGECQSWRFTGERACYFVVREPNIVTIGEVAACTQFTATVIPDN